MPKAIILAGGFGTRLRCITRYVPKPMVEINGKPFLIYLIEYLSSQGINEIILSVGYRSEVIVNYFRKKCNDIKISYAIEAKPLGTGGAIRNALHFVNSKSVFVINGDTLFRIDMGTLLDFHNTKSSDLTLALKYGEELNRFGKVMIGADGRIIGFEEKVPGKSGLINGGIYLIRRSLFDNIILPEKFSFETDFLEKFYKKIRAYGLAFHNYFIDIGISPDYEKAKIDFIKSGF
jgi:D-glycero-alpha-D-manno-heptose 1-phosphate guanylyltransferase